MAGRPRKKVPPQGPALLDFAADAPEHGDPIPGTAVRRQPGRTEKAVGTSIQHGRQGKPADPRFAAAEALARQLAYGVDQAAAKADPYALAQLGPKLLEVLRELALTPGAAGEGKSGFDAFMADLAKPE